MDFGLGARAEEFRAEVRAFIAEHVDHDLIERAWRSGTLHDWDLHRAMAERHWIAPSWPREFGGDDRDDFELMAMVEELTAAGVPFDGLRTTMLVVETLRHVGTEHQQRTIIPRVLSGEILICLGYSEPESGSDVASASTKAVRHGDDWIVTGQKMWTTLAHESAFAFVLARTDPDLPKHRGLTTFLVPMDPPAVQVRPIHTLGGQLVNATFFDDLRVPDAYRVGEVNGGWKVMEVGLAVERTVLHGIDGVLRRVVEWARQPGADGRRPIDDPDLRPVLARGTIDAHVAKLMCRRTTWVAVQGRLPGIEGSMAKLFGTETHNRFFGELIDVLGPEGLLAAGVDGAPVGGEVEREFRYGQFLTIGGGVSEVQRDVVAHRGLGLPRSK